MPTLPKNACSRLSLKAPAGNTVEDNRRRRNNAVLAVMAYCPIQEPLLLRRKFYALILVVLSVLGLRALGVFHGDCAPWSTSVRGS